jgi:hypothetical protein
MKIVKLGKGLVIAVLLFFANFAFAETFGNVYLGDVGHGYNWAGFGHKDVVSTLAYALIQMNDGTYTLINKKDTGSGYIGFRVNNADKMVILNNGNVGIGTTVATEKLVVANGNIYPNGENCGIIIDSQEYKRVGFMKYGGTEGSLVHGNTTPLRFGRVNQAAITGGAYTEEMRIDTNGRVGIGTTSPDYQLTVKAASGAYSIVGTDGAIKVGIQTFTPYNAGWFGTITNHPLVLSTNSTSRIMLDVNGNVGIGNDYPSSRLDVQGTITSRSTDSALSITPVGSGQMRLKTDATGRWMSFADGAGSTDVMAIKGGSVCIGTTTPQSGKTLTVTGSGYFTGIVTTGSSRTLKNEIRNLTQDEALEALKKLQPVKYVYKADESRTTRLGFIAEDVPELVAEKDRRSLNEMNFAALAITVIQKQQDDIELLKREIADLKSKLDSSN